MITQEELKKLQDLAKLHFSKNESSKLLKQLNSILEMMDSLSEINCKNMEPFRSILNEKQRTVMDEVKSGNISDQLFANIPASSGKLAKEINYFLVPKMVK